MINNLILVLLFSWLKFLPMVRLVGQEAWGPRYDYHYSREFIKKIPNRLAPVALAREQTHEHGLYRMTFK